MSIRFVDTRKPKGKKQFSSLAEGDAFIYRGLLHLVKQSTGISTTVSTLLITGSSVNSSCLSAEEYAQSIPVDVVMTVKDQE